ncbi:MAG: hypothetical protein R8G66_33140 [Cytophagales bacterium]|nr:hypothetical protein [Cytophagales bacterium]
MTDPDFAARLALKFLTFSSEGAEEISAEVLVSSTGFPLYNFNGIRHMANNIKQQKADFAVLLKFIFGRVILSSKKALNGQKLLVLES